MKQLAMALTIIAIGSPVVMEVTRSVVHRRRERLYGLGGTQDIAILGSLAGIGLAASAGVCWLIWLWSE